MTNRHAYPHETYEPVVETVRESLTDWGMLREGDNDLAEMLLQRIWDNTRIENYADLEALPVGAVIIEHKYQAGRAVGVKVYGGRWLMITGGLEYADTITQSFALPAHVLFKGGLSD